MRPYTILFINTHYAPDLHYGGVVQSGTALFSSLRRIYPAMRISVSSKSPEKVYHNLQKDKGDRCYKTTFFHRAGFSFHGLLGLFLDIKSSGMVLVNGLFSFHNTLAFLYAILLGKKIVVALRGGFEPWSIRQKGWKKRPYAALLRPLLRRASLVHVTSEKESGTALSLGIPPERVVMVPNGVELWHYAALPERSSPKSVFSFVFLSRMSREKGLDILLSAYREFRAEAPASAVSLRLVGPDFHGYLPGLLREFPGTHIECSPGLYGGEKVRALRDADCLVLPSYSENFGNVVAEALACETPVITTTGTPWAEIERVGCGLYIEPNAEALCKAMKAMSLKSPEERREMGRRGREYVLKNFNWEDKARELFEHLTKLVPAEKA
jgi:glycosyltransferase involved in cell wall biosynthesis